MTIITALCVIAFLLARGRPDKIAISKDWTPQSHGPIEIRELPPANSLHAAHHEWVMSSIEPKAHVYVATIFPDALTDWTREISRGGNALMDGVNYTTISFRFNDGAYGNYPVAFLRQGNYTMEQLAFEGRKKAWFQVSAAANGAQPALDLVSIEGIGLLQNVFQESRGWMQTREGGGAPIHIISPSNTVVNLPLFNTDDGL